LNWVVLLALAMGLKNWLIALAIHALEDSISVAFDAM
jgi:hypothetical protein